MKISDSSSCGGVEEELFRDPKSWPPGFRFHPTDEELVLYYLKRKICRRRLKLNVVKETDVYKWDPEELPGQSLLKSGDRQWYFFTPRDRKYPNGARSNRATRHGYWKATGKDRTITWNSRSVGVKKTLVFYKGRAPSGERTDWVMHEYTMDEIELQRCKNMKEYYVLYKLFKKSGPGPKNGEQYGAPFREEDWAEDDEVVENKTPKEAVEMCLNRSVVDDCSKNQCQPLVDDLDELFRELVGEPEENPLPNNEFASVLPQSSAQETRSTMIGSFLEEAITSQPVSWYYPESDEHGAEEEIQSTMMDASVEPLSGYPCQNQCDVSGSFHAPQSATSYMPPCEAPEGPLSNLSEWDSPSSEGVNYLEIDDLVGPQQYGVYNMTNASTNSQFGEGDGYHGSDLFFDAAMVLQGMETINQSSVSDPYIHNFNDNVFNDNVSNQGAYQMAPVSYDADQNNSQFWIQDERLILSEPAESHQVAGTPSSASVGAFHARNSINPSEEKQNCADNENDVDSWCSSAISAFLRSVPTRPALASENVLINRAFERMSSFGRVRIAPIGSGAATGVESVAERRVTRNGGLLFFSVLGAVCAVLWMLMIGTTLKLLKNFFRRFISS